MLDVDIDKLDASWKDQEKYLKDGLLAGDIWDRSTGLAVSSCHTSTPEANALFNVLTDELSVTLAGSGLPELNRFYLLNLEDNKIALIINHGASLLQGMLLNPDKVNMGILFSVAIPKALTQVAQAIN